MNPKHIIKKGSVVKIGMPKDTTSEFWHPFYAGMEVIVPRDIGWGAIERVNVIRDPYATSRKRITHKFAITSDEVNI